MDSYMLLGFVGILREVSKMLCKNGQLMACLTLLILSFYSIFFLSNIFSIKPLLFDMSKSGLVIATDPTTPQLAYLVTRIKEDISAIVGREWSFILISTITSLFFATPSIFLSAALHGGKNLSANKELFFSTKRSIIRPFYTWFYTALFPLGYNFFVLAKLLPMVLIVQNPFAVKALCIILVILASVLYIYLAVVWILALVISVLEEKSGIEALGKAAQLVKGMQVHGFLLNLLYTILVFLFQGIRLMPIKESEKSGIEALGKAAQLVKGMQVHNFLLNLLYTILVFLFQGIRLMPIKESSRFHITIGLLVVSYTRLVWMFGLMAFTVFYHQCKKTQ